MDKVEKIEMKLAEYVGGKFSSKELNIAMYFYKLGLKEQLKEKNEGMTEALRTEYEKGRHDIIEKTLKWLWDLNQEHEIMSYTDSHVLSSEELQKYYKNNIEE